MRPHRPFGLAFAPAPPDPGLASPPGGTRWLILQKARRHPGSQAPEAPTGQKRMVSGLFHSPRRGAFHRSLTVLVHYRSVAVFSLGTWSSPLPARCLVSGGTHAPRHARAPGSTLRGSHPLRRPVPVAFRRPGRSRDGSTAPSPRPSNPAPASPAGCSAGPVWAPPRSLAATGGILSSPRGTEMFQFPRCPPARKLVPRQALGGLPHSDTPGSLAASASPGRFAAWPRPSSAATAKASTMRSSSRPPVPARPRPTVARGRDPTRRRRPSLTRLVAHTPARGRPPPPSPPKDGRHDSASPPGR